MSDDEKEETEISKNNKLIYDLYNELLFVFEKVRKYYILDDDKDITFEQFIEKYGNPPGNKFLPINITKINLVLFHKATNKYIYVLFSDQKFNHANKNQMNRIKTTFDNPKKTHRHIFVFDTTIHGRGNFAQGKLRMRNLFTKQTRIYMSSNSKILTRNIEVQSEVLFINEIRPMFITSEKQFFLNRKRKRENNDYNKRDKKKRKFANKSLEIEIFTMRNEVNKIKETFHCENKMRLPTIHSTDMVCKTIGAHVGNIVSISASNETSGRNKLYKLVV